jgi:hypothetical protein
MPASTPERVCHRLRPSRPPLIPSVSRRECWHRTVASHPDDELAIISPAEMLETVLISCSHQRVTFQDRPSRLSRPLRRAGGS